MAKPLRPFVRGGGYYPSKKWIPLVRNGGYTTQNGGETEPVWATASGAIASFTTPFAYPLKKLMAEINPVQDLHGYENPWPAGGMGNKWNEDWEVGTINVSSGVESATNNSIRSKSYSPCTPDTDYYVFCGAGSSQWFLGVCWYDENKQFISGGYRNRMTVTSPSNAAYFKITTNTSGDVYGNTYNQDIAVNNPATVTTYAPYSNICPISGWTGVSGQRTGANVFDQSNVLDFYVGGVGGTTVGIGGTFIAMPVIKGVTYTINGTIGDRSGLYYTDLAPSEITYGVVLTPNTVYQWLSAFPFTFTAHDTCTLCFYVNTDWDQTIADSIYAVVGSSASDFTPYTGEAISVSFGQTVYGGSDEVVGGELTKTFGDVDLGTLNWTYGSTYNRFTSSVIPNVKTPSNNYEVPNIICSIYKATYPNDTATEGKTGLITVMQNGTLTVRDTRFTNAEDLKTAISGQQLVYELATPTSFTHTGQSVDTLVGQNNIWTTTGDVEVTYRIE